MKDYFRPLIQTDPIRATGAYTLASGWGWFTHVQHLNRSGGGKVIAADDAPASWISALTQPRPAIAGLDFSRPRLMGILNVTPDSFSDGGRFNAPEAARARALALESDGADIIDIGGESTRPGADFIPVVEEKARTVPVIEAVRRGSTIPISIDTRKAAVADAALHAGAGIVNDVAAFTFEPDLARIAAAAGAPVCLMHAQGDPATMQNDPSYANVLLDVYDFLEERVEFACAQGIPRENIIVDPGIGFGKTVAHNLALIAGLSLFHGLGCPVLLGVSRKKFIGTLGNAPDSDDRLPGSLAIALRAVEQGVQIIRAHDIAETRQALTLWEAAAGLCNEQDSE